MINVEKKKKYILANKTNQRLTKIKLLFPEEGPNTQMARLTSQIK
jgi:hypothetical protein